MRYRFRDPPLYRNRGRNVDRAEKLQSYLTINGLLVQRVGSLVIHSTSIEIAVCVVVSRLFRNHQIDHVERKLYLAVTTHRRSRFNYPMSLHDGEIRHI